MKVKSYTKNGVTYTYDPKYRKWTFVMGTHTLIQSCPGGSETAHKVANIVSGSVNRIGSIDGMARSNISRLTTVNP